MKKLLKLYSFESVHLTPDETALANWLEQWFKDHDIKYNRHGDNFYCLEYPCVPILSAHLDQVKTNGKAVHFNLTPEHNIEGYNEDWERTSLGGDDKNGVWIILDLLEQGVKFNFIISAGEETGCVGIGMLNTAKVLDKIKELQTFCIVLDRRGNKDVLESGGGTTYCKTLAQDICNYLEDMTVTSGSVSDTATICEYCESVNMSVAYEAPHTAKEHTDWKRLQEIRDYVKLLVTDFIHYPTPPSVYCKKSYYDNWKSTYGKGANRNGKGKNYWDDDEYWAKWGY